ncbi:unnamed protein product [Rotaria socialis]|uniref:DZF domain-containing protein n=1 Tax=Rotaria socialis TaxID=392032 RepID=A0A817Y065_9BILA|nr:unnamed protein product [Rotaria socialis]CAF3360060.1 unnamed protein product [Rotaria socialis]CAF3363111.1 unnamed protein product [Rotaria socialis]CAF3373132.1 unnamed protein product [Rotaria socialis]CAF3792344.1 unnamed protein product [Rotaria socialis]
MRRSRPRFPSWRQNRPQYQQSYRPQSSQYQQAQSSDVFDFLNLPESFPAMKQLIEDPILTPIIMERNQQLAPSSADNFALINFVTCIRQKLDALVLSPNSFAACQISEVRDVGSHKHNTIILPPMGSHLTSDLVVVLKTLPTREAIDQLGNRLKQDFQNEIAPQQAALLSMKPTNDGLSLDNGTMAVHLLLTTLPANWHSLDPTIHLDRAMCKRNFNAIKHAKWVDEVCIHPSIKVLVRLLKDLRQRFRGLEPLNPWLINLLAHHCVTNNNSTEQLPPSYAFKRALQLLSSGLFLPGFNGLYDPFSDANMHSSRSYTTMTLEEQDRLCYTSQTLLRALAIHPKYVLGIEHGPDIFAGPCQLNGVLFTPNEPIVFDTESNGYPINDGQQQTMLVEVNS